MFLDRFANGTRVDTHAAVDSFIREMMMFWVSSLIYVVKLRQRAGQEEGGPFVCRRSLCWMCGIYLESMSKGGR